MEIDMKKPELLSPAGDYTCFQAALKAGADAVYIGGQQYGARAYAGNFSDEEILRALDEAHFYGRKIYLTVNTLMRQKELDHLEEFIAPFYEAGLDGVIVQDVGALAVLGQRFPNLPLHASTQLAITDADGAKELKRLGIVRVVPARELSLRELIALKEESGLEIETFIHGAMCYCYSGQCLFSSMLGGRSGNRGRCAQPCRQPYSIWDGKAGQECYPLSLKDMCTVDFLPALIDAGIDSFKIEGRMKKPEYVAGVTDVYRRRIDSYCASPEKKQKVSDADHRRLHSLYVRSAPSGGYYEKHNGREMITLSQPGYAGCEEEVLSQVRTKLLASKLEVPVCMEARLQVGLPALLEVRELAPAGEKEEPLCVSVEGAIVQQALNRPLAEEEIRKQLEKTGGSGFAADTIRITLEGDCFLPVKALNELRRNALETLRRKRITAHMPYTPVYAQAVSVVPRESEAHVLSRLSATVRTIPQLKECLRAGVTRLYLPYQAFGPKGLHVEDVQENMREGVSCFLSLPVILREETRPQMEGVWRLLCSGCFQGAQIASLSGLGWLKERGYQGRIAFDHRIYIWNRQTWEVWKDEMDTYCAPLELNARELFALPWQEQRGKRELLVYGRIPMMVTANCIRKTQGKCPKDRGLRTEDGAGQGGQLALLDRYRTRFPVETDCRYCYNILYNSVPLSLHAYLPEIQNGDNSLLRFDFLEEGPEAVREVLELFQAKMQGKEAKAEYPFTTGHFKKGAQ